MARFRIRLLANYVDILRLHLLAKVNEKEGKQYKKWESMMNGLKDRVRIGTLEDIVKEMGFNLENWYLLEPLEAAESLKDSISKEEAITYIDELKNTDFEDYIVAF